MRRGYRQAPYIPFKGIDYLGGILWSLWLICIIFILVYGEHYDWLDSEEIRTAIVFAVILLVMCLERAASIRHPYISLKTFSQRNMLFIFILHTYILKCTNAKIITWIHIQRYKPWYNGNR